MRPMHLSLPFSRVWVLALALGVLPSFVSFVEAAEQQVAVATPLPATAQAFLRNYCTDCHDDATATAKLSLESLPGAFADLRWVRVYDKVVAEKMPPADASQPEPAERAAFAGWLHKELQAASHAKQQAEGRVALRRMNRVEYEHALHDLLGIAEPLAHLLPEDSPVGGFDTVSEGLETSATHLVRYQDAAEAALQAALPGRPVKLETVRLSGQEFFDSRSEVQKKALVPYIRMNGSTMVLYARVYKHGSIQTPKVPLTARYRIRASVRAINTTGRPLPVLLGRIRPDRFAHEKLEHIVAIRDAPADRFRVLEVETMLPQGDQVYLEGQELLMFHGLQKQRDGRPIDDAYTGPGLAVEWIELEGPLKPNAGYRRLFGELPQLPRSYAAKHAAGEKLDDRWKKWKPYQGEFAAQPLVAISDDPQGDAERLLRDFLPRAFRRPVNDATVAYFVEFTHDQLAAGQSFDDALRASYKAALCSPHFIFYLERPGPLDNYAVASRLARFLWSSTPDEQLLAVAAAGRLREPEVLRAETERMLRDPKAGRFVENFTGQWLDLRKFLDMKPDPIYVEYDDHLAWAMPEETRHFFAEVLAHDLPTSSFLHSDWTFLNARLAQHYGIQGVEGLEMRRVALPPEARRGGVITHASVLKLTTNATYTSPVKRGAWVLDRLLGQTPDPPPPDVEAVEPDIRGAVTIREQLALHQSVTVCATCHVHIDPPGFALENYDVIGGWREAYRVKQAPKDGRRVELENYPGQQVWLAKPVEAGGKTAEGHTFDGLDEYKQLVLADPDQLTRGLAHKLIAYATGAEVQYADRVVVEQIVRDVRAQNHGFRSLVHAVIQSRIFLSK